jgi:hypothetical protein
MTLSIEAQPRPLAGVASPVPLIRSSDVSHPEQQIASRRLVRVRRGILAPAQLWSRLAPWQRYTARVHAVAMMRPDVVFCLESAAALLGLPVFGEPPDVHVLDAPDATARLHGGIRLHTTSGDRSIGSVGGLLLTSATDTAVDLARLRHGAVGLSVADAVLRADPSLTVEALVAANESRTSSRGRRAARWALHRASTQAATALESVSRAAIEWLGFAEPELQQEFRTDGIVDRCDMWWREVRIVGESDGDVKYDDSLQPSADAIRKEKARDRRLRRHASGIAHWGWADVATVRPLAESLRHAGLFPVNPESSRELHALTVLLARRRP